MHGSEYVFSKILNKSAKSDLKRFSLLYFLKNAIIDLTLQNLKDSLIDTFHVN